MSGGPGRGSVRLMEKTDYWSKISCTCALYKTKAMNILKTVICAALLVAGLGSCEKIDVNKLEGTWSEQYDPTVFAMDGSVTFTFDGNNGYQLRIYDALSGESHDYSGHYAIDMEVNKGLLAFFAEEEVAVGGVEGGGEGIGTGGSGVVKAHQPRALYQWSPGPAYFWRWYS